MGMCLAFKLPSRATIIVEGKRKIGAALAVPGFEQAKTKKVEEVEGEDTDEERGGKNVIPREEIRRTRRAHHPGRPRGQSLSRKPRRAGRSPGQLLAASSNRAAQYLQHERPR
jgi:hypothetical protein